MSYHIFYLLPQCILHITQRHHKFEIYESLKYILSRHRKFEIYVVIVLSKLLYGLESVVLKVHDIRKLNGFHASCCRRLLNIQPAFISRVSNTFVLKQFNTISLHAMILKRQLNLFGTLARRSHTDIARSLILQRDSLDPKMSDMARKRGRPRKTWMINIWQHVQNIRNDRNLQSIIESETLWRKEVSTYCASFAD